MIILGKVRSFSRPHAEAHPQVLIIPLQSRVMVSIVQRTVLELRADIAGKLHRIPLSESATQHHGATLSLLTNDVDNVQLALTLTLTVVVPSLLTIAGVGFMLADISLPLAIIAAVAIPVSLAFCRAVSKRSRRMYDLLWETTGQLNAHAEEALGCMETLTAYGQVEGIRLKFGRLNETLCRSGLRAQIVAGLVVPITALVGQLAFVSIAIVGCAQALAGYLTIGGVQAALQYVRLITEPISHLAGSFSIFQSGLASLSRIRSYLGTPEEAAGAQRSLPPVRGEVTFDSVTFSYGNEDRPALQSVSFTASPGSRVAVIGHTGAGKSTLVSLLLRLTEPDSGRILLDEIDISELSRGALRGAVGVVLQDAWIFSGTIYDNIRYGDLNATQQDVHAVAEATSVDDFVRSLPDGYDTHVGHDGCILTSAQRQLISIARTMLSRPKVVVLDEVMASLDPRAERTLSRAIDELRDGRTTFEIAHRLTRVRDADSIIVLRAGQIVESGTHEELWAMQGDYWSVCHAWQATASSALPS